MTRKATGISQEELCWDICSVETLSRIENGKHSVKRETYERLMSRMGRLKQKCYAICTGNDMELLEERRLLESALIKHDYQKAEEYLNELKEKIADNILNEQYVRNTEAFLKYFNHTIDAGTLVEEVKNIIKLTAPDYEKYIDSVYPYTEQELLMLMRLACAYAEMENHEKSISLYNCVLRCLNNGYMADEEVIYFKIVIMRNYAVTLQQLSRYKEASECLEEILEMSIKNNCGYMVPIAMHGIVWSKMRMYRNGDETIDLEELKKMKQQAYYIAAAKDDYVIKDIIKKTYKEDFGEDINII